MQGGVFKFTLIFYYYFVERNVSCNLGLWGEIEIFDVFLRCKLSLDNFGIRHEKCLTSFQRFLLLLVLGQDPLPATVVFCEDVGSLVITEEQYRNFLTIAGLRDGEGLVCDHVDINVLDKMLIVCFKGDFNLLHVCLVSRTVSEFFCRYVGLDNTGCRYGLVPVLHFSLGHHGCSNEPVRSGHSFIG
tara:strand:+ start:751 stop:1311 length:561 start_codon:yes stop_codon:yes gene_type:complete